MTINRDKMNNQEDFISDLFKENEQLFDEQPSRRAWMKLEKKLDQQKSLRTRRIYRSISTAAAVMAVVAMISAIAIFKNGNGLITDNQKTPIKKQDHHKLALDGEASEWRKEYAPESIEKTTPVVAEIGDFKWLIGAWSNHTENGKSSEKWSMNSDNILEGKGILLVNNYTVFAENMQIKEINDKIHFVSNFGTDDTMLQFELVKFQDGVATFENKASKSPQAVIISLNDKDNFTITFQEAANQKLQFRNKVVNAKAFRKMTRDF